MHKALIVGAGRIGAGFGWHDMEYTHAGAYKAHSDRVELMGFVEPDVSRALIAQDRWGVPAGIGLEQALETTKADMVSVCSQPDEQFEIISRCLKVGVRYFWCEKPYKGPHGWPGAAIQVNYMRRGDPAHQFIAANADMTTSLVVYGKDDETTRCHFEDLAKWWKCKLDYRPFNGPCAYIVTGAGSRWFDNGGVNGGACFKAMLGNLLDHMDNGTPLWSPAQ